MPDRLLVPIRIDALYLKEDTLMTEPSVDFARLPFFNGTRDIHADVANISENFVAPPLQNQNQRLPRGLHLHWSLPDALTKGEHKQDFTSDRAGIEFPAVPNRWQITRLMNGRIKRWVVESDFLWPEEKDYDKILPQQDYLQRIIRQLRSASKIILSNGNPLLLQSRVNETLEVLRKFMDSLDVEKYPDARILKEVHLFSKLRTAAERTQTILASLSPITEQALDAEREKLQNVLQDVIEDRKRSITYPIADAVEPQQPFRYVGRTIPVEEYDPTPKTGHQYLSKLTAIGYGEPTFAAFYPNCRSVFGFHDPEVTEETDDVRYYVFGWYENEEDEFLAYLKKRHSRATIDLAALSDIASWTIDTVPPERLLCYAKLNFNGHTEASVVVDENTFKASLLTQLNARQEAFRSLPDPTPSAITALSEGMAAASETNRLDEVWQELQRAKWMAVDDNRILPIEQRKPGFLKLGDDGLITQTMVQAALQPSPDNPDTVSLANTGTEALAARLAHEIAPPPANLALVKALEMDYRENEERILALELEIKRRAFEQDDNRLRTLQARRNTLGTLNSNLDVTINVLQEQLAPAITSNRTARLQVEDQLEALLFAEELDQQKLDIGAKFRELRHREGFNAVAPSGHWVIRLERDSEQTAQEMAEAELSLSTLPITIAETLHQLNDLQKQYDGNIIQIDTARQQLFSDWYKYMMSTYPPQDSLIDFPDIDEVRYFIHEKDLRPLWRLLLQTGRIHLDSPTSPTQATTDFDINPSDELAGVLKRELNEELVFPTESLATQLADKLQELWTQLQTENRKLCLLKQQDIKDWDRLKEVVLTIASPELIALFDTLSLETDIRDKTQQLALINGINQSWEALSEEDLQAERLHMEQLLPGLIRPHTKGFYRLQRITGPRYWQPKEPSLLITGDIAQVSDRFARDGQLACTVGDILFSDGTTIGDSAIAVVEGQGEGPLGTRQADGQPWNPFLLEWEVEICPYQAGSNSRDGNYQATYLTDKVHLPVNGTDLIVTRPEVLTGRNPNLYNGRSILTTQATKNLHTHLNIYTANHPKPTTANHDDPSWIAHRAKEILEGSDFKDKVLSQVLSGFNNALLMLRQSFQMPVADPLGFSEYHDFTRLVAHLVGQATKLSPQPLTDFSPIRGGDIRINQLRVVDTFGQYRELNFFDPSTGVQIQGSSMGESILDGRESRVQLRMPPRLAQAARLQFRWLAAEQAIQDEALVEMNAHPATSPICGWLLSNQLDGSLMVFDAKGRSMGAIENEDADERAKWRAAPGSTGMAEAELNEDHVNIYLLRLINYIRDRKRHFVEDFIKSTSSVLQTIQPETFAQQQALALLMGRPMALVRASLDLELKGKPAVQHSWEAFYRDRQDGLADRRETDNYMDVRYPIRLGAVGQSNDGLIGYWLENEQEEMHTSPFYLNQVEDKKAVLGVSHDDIPFLQNEVPIDQALTPADPVHTLSMLIDPRGKVNAYTGILPVKTIDIPSQQFLPALQAIDITFLTAPVLSPTSTLFIPLPKEEGYEWSWVEKTGIGSADYQERYSYPSINKSTFVNAYSEELWDLLHTQQWLQNIPYTTEWARITSTDQRIQGALELDQGGGLIQDITYLRGEIDSFLTQNQLDIEPSYSEARFLREQLSIREGWLKLQRIGNTILEE